MSKKAVIFDLDGVIVSTDEYHYEAWKRMASDEGIYFDREINQSLRGISRMDSLEIILKNSDKVYSDEEKILLAERKNKYYRDLLNSLTADHILPGVMQALSELKYRRIKIAISSSSKNAAFILQKLNLDNCFDVIVDGNEIKKSKPDPEVFLIAAKKLQVRPEDCVVIEDAESGVEAAIAGGMKVVAVGFASKSHKAHFKSKDLTSICIDKILM